MIMSTSAQCLPRQGLSLCTVLRPAAATALHAASALHATTAEAASSETTNKGSPDDTITIIIAIIGALLTLVSVIVALLQYRLQVQRSRDEERNSDVIAMEPQPPARLARPT
jgi:beta-lactamase regulating signal transducer with metallopeptidase domain